MAIVLAGIDGTKDGWAMAKGTIINNRMTDISVEFIRAINLSSIKDLMVIAIDIPIGLAEQTQRGGRLAEQQARKLLNGRKSSIFSTPCRPCIEANTYKEALAISRASGPEKIGLSIQSYHILPKIKETDALLQEHKYLRNRIYECHPELSFQEMKGQNTPLNSKHQKNGRKERQDLLAKLDFQPKNWHRKIPITDQLDAMACLWSANRLYFGHARQVPETPPRDGTGLIMAIHW